MSAANIITEAFGEDALSDLYGVVLGVTVDASPSQLRKAYHKRALLYHPDKISNIKSSASSSSTTKATPTNDATVIEHAKIKFQAISVTYQILSNDESRKEYDDTGELVENADDDDDDFTSNSSTNKKSGFDQWKAYFQTIFGTINFNDIDNFANKYKHSQDEQRDVLKYYVSCKGNLNKMITCVMCSSQDDKDRWVRDYINPAIDRGDVERYDALAKTMDDQNEEDDDDSDSGESVGEENARRKSKRTRKKSTVTVEKPSSEQNGSKKKSSSTSKKLSKREREAKEAEELFAKIRGKKSDNGNSLAKRREEAFGCLISDLENKYGRVKPGKERKKMNTDGNDDIPDDEFDRLQEQLNANRKSKKKKV